MANKETSIFVRVTAEEKDRLRRQAEAKDVSVSKLIRDLIRAFLRENEQREVIEN